jgi:predicted nucleic acid-binding protein
LAGRLVPLVSVPLMLEYEAVLTRPEQLAVSGATARDVSYILDGLAAVGKQVKLMFRWRPALLDPNDDMVLETAINGHADAIITFNERDFNPIAAQFGCLVMRPGDLVRALRSKLD